MSTVSLQPPAYWRYWNAPEAQPLLKIIRSLRGTGSSLHTEYKTDQIVSALNKALPVIVRLHLCTVLRVF